jgi:hypothetical protein
MLERTQSWAAVRWLLVALLFGACFGFHPLMTVGCGGQSTRASAGAMAGE